MAFLACRSTSSSLCFPLKSHNGLLIPPPGGGGQCRASKGTPPHSRQHSYLFPSPGFLLGAMRLDKSTLTGGLKRTIPDHEDWQGQDGNLNYLPLSRQSVCCRNRRTKYICFCCVAAEKFRTRRQERKREKEEEEKKKMQYTYVRTYIHTNIHNTCVYICVYTYIYSHI